MIGLARPQLWRISLYLYSGWRLQENPSWVTPVPRLSATDYNKLNQF
jgi:hypothetical protein